MKYCLHRDKLMSTTANPTILTSKILYCHACRTDLERRAGRISAKRGRKSRVRRLRTKQKQGVPTRTHPEKSTYDSDMYNRAFPVGNALFFFAWDMMSLLRLPRGKLPLTFLAVPAGEDRRVECPCQTVNDFIGVGGSVCGLLSSFDYPSVAKPGEKINVPIFIRRKGADAFRPALAAAGSLMAYKCLSLCRFRGFAAGFCKNFVQRFQKLKMRFQGKEENLDLFRMRKKFRVQVERNLPTLSHERFSVVESVVQFEKLLGNIIVFINK